MITPVIEFCVLVPVLSEGGFTILNLCAVCSHSSQHRSVASSSSRDSVVDISAGLHHGGHHASHHLAARSSSASPSPPPSQSPALLVLPGAAEEPAAVAALRLESQLTVSGRPGLVVFSGEQRVVEVDILGSCLVLLPSKVVVGQ